MRARTPSRPAGAPPPEPPSSARSPRRIALPPAILAPTLLMLAIGLLLHRSRVAWPEGILPAGPEGSPYTAQSGDQPPPAAARLSAWGGYSAVAPENTLAAIEAARAAGAPSLWLDLRATRDGELVLLRDATLDRTTDCSGRVSESPLASVVACDAGRWFGPAFAGQTVPRLTEALAAAGDAALVLELHAGQPEALMSALREAGVGRATVISRDRGLLGQLAIISSIQFQTVLRVDVLEPRLLTGLPEQGIFGLATTPEGLDPGLAAGLPAAGLALLVGPADDEGALLAALAAGAERVAVARYEPLAFASGLALRSFAADAFGLPLAEDQQLGGGLAAGDFDADGQADLALGAPRDRSAGLAAGWLGVLIGEARFPGRLEPDPGDEEGGEWGSPLLVADLGGDGFEDLVVGVPQRDFNGGNSGAIWLWDGAAEGIGRFKRPIGPQPQPGSRLGRALAAGDFDADGLTDLFVSAPLQVVRGLQGAGRVFALPGQAGSGAVTTGALIVDREPEEVPGEPLARENLGAALAAGDFNGDGHDDLAIGAPGAAPGDQAGAGLVLLVFGGPDDPETGDLAPLRYVELSRDAEEVPGFAERDAAFGTALLAADLDGDGFDDLAVGAPGASPEGQRGAGDVTLFYGRADRGTPGEPDEETGAFDLPRTQVLDLAAGAIPGGLATRAAFGTALAAGDLDGDGRPELLVASGETLGRAQGAGALYLLFGSADGPDAYRPLRLAPGMFGLGIAPATGQAFGSRLATGDFNGDGVVDLALGAPGSAVGALERAGMLLVAFGYDPELPGVPTPTAPPAAPSATSPPTVPVTPSITATASATPRPPAPAYLPIGLNLQSFFGRWPTPAP